VVGLLGQVVALWMHGTIVCGMAGSWCEAGGCGAMWEVLGMSMVVLGG